MTRLRKNRTFSITDMEYEAMRARLPLQNKEEVITTLSRLIVYAVKLLPKKNK